MPDVPPRPSREAFLQALAQHGDHPVMLELRVLDLTLLVGALQLVLRHPHLPAPIRAAVEAVVAGAIQAVGSLDPALRAILEAGNDPTQDVEARV